MWLDAVDPAVLGADVVEVAPLHHALHPTLPPRPVREDGRQRPAVRLLLERKRGLKCFSVRKFVCRESSNMMSTLKGEGRGLSNLQVLRKVSIDRLREMQTRRIQRVRIPEYFADFI